MTTSCAVVSHERAFVGEAVRIVPDPGALRFSRVRQSIMRLHRSRHYKTVKGTARMAEGLVGRGESRSTSPCERHLLSHLPRLHSWDFGFRMAEGRCRDIWISAPSDNCHPPSHCLMTQTLISGFTSAC